MFDITDAPIQPLAFDSQVLDPGIATMEPGIFLAAALTSIDLDALSGHDRVMVLEAHQRMASYYAAKMYEDMGAVADAYQVSEGFDRLDAIHGATAEVRVALHLTRRAADTEFEFSVQLATRLPRVAKMLKRGLIDVRRAKAIDHATVHLSTAAAQSVVDRIAEVAPNLTTSQIMARIRKLAIAADPAAAEEQYQFAVQRRRVVIEPTTDGTSHLYAFDLAPDTMAEASMRINALARSLNTKDETRTMDQLRADVLVDLLLGTATSTEGRRGKVDIRVDLDTLGELTSHPGELAGYGPVIADIARQVGLANIDGEWLYTLTDTETNTPLATGITSRRPTVSTKRAVQSATTSCVFPGCRMPASTCDLDHTMSWAWGGVTAPGNLKPLCRHDHRIKHVHGWAYRKNQDGTITWTTRLGHTRTQPAEPP